MFAVTSNPTAILCAGIFIASMISEVGGISTFRRHFALIKDAVAYLPTPFLSSLRRIIFVSSMVAFGDLISDLSFVAHLTYCCEDNVVEDDKNGTCDCSDFSQRWNETCANV